MTDFLEKLSARRRFGMKPRLDAMRAVCASLGEPQAEARAIHVAGTNGKGAVCAMLDACLRAQGLSVGRYTSPHLVRLAERFFLDGRPVDDATLERAAKEVAAVAPADLTFFEALTAVTFLLFARARPDYAVLETGLGGRLDATNVCCPALCVITRIGLDHCEWLGDTVEKIAAEKAGIVKPGVPVVLGA
ncbi:MAG: bifunctional folylpolyglutamate synthase/dihydrofolate synthase, partial [Kiritimatiellae bacterium]|nr:bifunctional folylpolyglutamate synthase/dihydrofolate synthase [Kiritimatiellia bacterium]